MQSKATTVEQYLAELPVERREALQAIRSVVLKHLPTGYAEGMQYGMIGYYVPHSVYPPGYHCDPKMPLPFAALASQKNYMSIYLMCIYGDGEHERWFREAWAKSGKKLDMGKSCVRVKKIEDVPLEVIGQAVQRVPVRKFIERYESARKGITAKPSTQAGTKTAPTKKAAAVKAAPKKVPTKKPAAVRRKKT